MLPLLKVKSTKDIKTRVIVEIGFDESPYSFCKQATHSLRHLSRPQCQARSGPGTSGENYMVRHVCTLFLGVSIYDE